MINGVDKLAITKLDVLDDQPELKICVAYEVNGVKTEDMPSASGDLENLTPIYETMEGWQEPTTSATSFEELPEKAKKYLKRIAELVEAEIGIVSVGPKRAQTFEA
jgi:adenylosuccinate synthase